MFFNLVKQFIFNSRLIVGILSVGASLFVLYSVWILKQKDKYKKYFKNITWALIVLYLLLIISIIIGQYYSFIPGLRKWDYVLHYTWFHGVGFHTIAIGVGMILFGLTAFINKLGHYRFFYEEEYWLMALGGLIIGFPDVIIFLGVLLLLAVLAQIVLLIKKINARISLIYFWPIAVLVAYFLGGIISKITGVYNLRL
jgi:hypothetical protein